MEDSNLSDSYQKKNMREIVKLLVLMGAGSIGWLAGLGAGYWDYNPISAYITDINKDNISDIITKSAKGRVRVFLGQKEGLHNILENCRVRKSDKIWRYYNGLQSQAEAYAQSKGKKRK